MKTAIEELKENWLKDPIWDIYTTEGFENNEKELKEFQEEWEQRWEISRITNLNKKAEEIGCVGNIKLIKYIEMLEYRIEQLERN